MSYDIHLDDKYGHMQLVDIPAEIAAHEPWFNQTLTTVNDSVVRLGIIEGDFHFHKHDDDDEFFLVLEGTLLIDFEDATRSPSSATRASQCQMASSPAPARPTPRRGSWSSRRAWCRRGIGCFARRSRAGFSRPE